jgi:hypothetical protein
MPSARYNKIRQLIVAEKAMSANYKAGPLRSLWPMVIGTSPKPNSPSQDDEIVLCYQFAGPNPPTGWRCFKVTSLTNITEIAATGRPNMTPRKLARQSCVQDRDVPP